MNRRISVNTTGLAVPQSFITKGKQRLKQHVDTVYLNNGDEFEIELYNPTQNKILAKIEVNGNSIGNGIVLRPGERVFLERYLDEAKKFLFETYIVNGNSEEVKQAIANNGDVVVKFYDEVKPINYYTSSNGTLTINSPNTLWPSTTGTPYYGNTFTTTSTSTNAAYFNNATYTSGTFSTLNTILKKNATSPTRHVETGRVEKGSNSDQSFIYDNSSFYSYPTASDWWKIKPQSTKPLMKEDLVVYCTECGSKRKKDNHKFCPHCGTKF